MSYQDFINSTQATAEKLPSVSPSQSPAHVIHRKPPANYSPLPFPASNGSVHKHVAQFNNLRSASISSQSPSTSPLNSTNKRSFSPITTASPVTVTKTIVEPLHNRASSPALTPVDTSTPASATNSTNDYPPPPPHAEWHAPLKACLALQNNAVKSHNKRPFAALLLGPDKSTTLLTHLSISHVQHAESELARLASLQYSIEYLRNCTLISTWEPCAMCAGTIYWSGIGRVVYAASESKLKDLTGSRNTENMTMDLPCRTIFAAGQSNVEVVGPVPGWEDKVVEESRKWWQEHKPGATAALNSANINGHGSAKSDSVRSHRVVTNPPPAEGVYSRIGEDGEYKADLKVDWMS